MIDNKAGLYIWQGELKMITSRQVSLTQGLIQAFVITWDQCSKTMKGKLEQLPTFQQINTDKDPMRLLEEIRNIMCGRESHCPPIYTMVQLIKMLCTFFQHADITNEDYKEQFESLWECVIQQGGSLTNHLGLINDRADQIAQGAGQNERDDNNVTEATELIASEMKAAFMLSRATA